MECLIKLTPIIMTSVFGGFGLYIAYQQYRVNRDDLRLALFDRRLNIYDGLQDFFSIVKREANVSRETLQILSEVKQKSRFLFGEEILQHFDELREKACDLHIQDDKLNGDNSLPKGDERSRISEAHGALLKWFNKQMEQESPKIFQKYMRFKTCSKY